MDRVSQCTVALSSFLLFLTVKIQAADVCADVVKNCRTYGQSVCVDYENWAKVNCKYTCKFCQGPPPLKPCVDSRSDCSNYISDICTSPSYRTWAEDNCPKYCGFCSTANATTSATVQTTNPSLKTTQKAITSTPVQSTPVQSTKPPVKTTQKVTTPCVDGLQFCLVYSKNACVDTAWADKYCRKHCARC